MYASTSDERTDEGNHVTPLDEATSSPSVRNVTEDPKALPVLLVAITVRVAVAVMDV
jgi:hypothetical protein